MDLVKDDAPKRQLMESTSIVEVKNIKSFYKSIADFARQSKDFETMNWASEIRIRAERRMGEMLRDQEMNTGAMGIGKVQSHDVTALPTLAEVGIDKMMSSRAQKIANVPEAEFEAVIEEYKSDGKELTSVVIYNLSPGHPHVSQNSGENEWYTPPEFIESARAVMGSIDLDPASSEIANKIVNAATYYTKEDDGLPKQWQGNVWLNPPYSQPLIKDFSDKLCSSVDSLHINQAVVLVNNATDTTWFQNMAWYSSAICFVNKRIKYLDSELTPANTPLQGQSFLFFGEMVDKFIDEFSKHGFVLIQTNQ